MMVVGQSFTISSATDDQGNPFAITQGDSSPAGGSSGPGQDALARINRLLWTVTVARPANPKSTISLKGQAILHIITKSATTSIADPEKHLNEPIKVGGRDISITGFSISVPSSHPDDHPEAFGSPNPALTAFDATAKQGSAADCPLYVISHQWRGRKIHLPLLRRQHPNPRRNAALYPHLYRPAQWKSITIPLDLKDLLQP